MSVRAVPFNIVHGSGVTAQELGLEGEGSWKAQEELPARGGVSLSA